MAGEGGIRVAAMVDHPALAVRDPDAVRNEMPDGAHANPRRDVNSNTPRLDAHQSVWDPVRVTLQPIQPPMRLSCNRPLPTGRVGARRGVHVDCSALLQSV